VKQAMQTAKFIHWRDGDKSVGYFVDYPDYWTQGESFDDLKDHLVSLHRDLTSGGVPSVRMLGEQIVS
jgi:hypothetical protein